MILVTATVLRVRCFETPHEPSCYGHPILCVDCERLLNLEEQERPRSGTEQFNQLYKEHIQVEEKIVFPRAAEMLDSQKIVNIGLEFHARRE